MTRIACTLLMLNAVLLGGNVALGQYPGSTPMPASYKPGIEAIRDQDTKTWLSILAGPEFAGRGTGQVGYTKAAHWIAGKCAEFGLEPIGDGGTYFQNLPMTRKVLDEQQTSLEGPDGLKIAGSDLGFSRYPGEPQVAGKVAFVNMAGADAMWSSDNNVADRVVIYVADENVPRQTYFRMLQQRPVAILTVSAAKPVSQADVALQGRRRSSGGRLQASITPETAEKIAQACGVNEDILSDDGEPGVEVALSDAELVFNVRTREEQASLPNVVAWLPGTDNQVNDEYLTIGAHLDHLGTNGERVFPGADDNGSGSTAILQVAKALSIDPPKRSVLFIWFAAEERGLIGSKFYCDNPIKPLDKMICMLNIDMIGRNEEKDGESAEENEDTIHLVGSQRGDTGLHQVILDANKYVGLKFEFDEEQRVFSRSDQNSFFRKGVAVAFLFGGFNPHYHQTSDNLEDINFEKIANAARLYFITAKMAAEHGMFTLNQ